MSSLDGPARDLALYLCSLVSNLSGGDDAAGVKPHGEHDQQPGTEQEAKGSAEEKIQQSADASGKWAGTSFMRLQKRFGLFNGRLQSLH